MDIIFRSHHNNTPDLTFDIMPFGRFDDVKHIVVAWTQSFAEPPNDIRQADALMQQLYGHFNFPDFHGFVARSRINMAVLGMIYGYSNMPGQWWYNTISCILDSHSKQQYLDNSYCLTELGVLPQARRMGIANALADRLIMSQPKPYVVLSTRSDNTKGLSFYRTTGWKVLYPSLSFGINYPPYDILIKSANPDISISEL